MMMSKPSSEQTETEEASATLMAFASPPKAAPLNVGSVADLERRLAEMGSMKKSPPPAQAPVPAPAAPPTVTAPAPLSSVTNPSASVKGGKSALLARIMAAKEKQQAAKQQKSPPPPPPPPAPMAPPPAVDLLGDFDAPPAINDLPPPTYETNFLKDLPPPAFDSMGQQQQQQPQPPLMQMQMPPPAFDSMVQQQMQFPPPPPIDSVLPPPPPLEDVLPPPPMHEGDLLDMDMGMPSAPSAPMFEDLHMQQQEFHPPPLPPPMEAAPPGPDIDIDESILNALEPAEREAFLEEQRKILEQIEREKANNEASGAAARAMAFDQRSSSAVANVAASYEQGGRSSSRSSGRPSSGSGGTMVNLGGAAGEVAVRGSEDTQRAIEDGTAVVVKCMSCDQWMQVTEAAELMFCPICQCVCPVEKQGAATTANMEAAAQLAADAELAQKLQKEEYAGAEQRRSRTTTTRTQSSESETAGKSWYDWLTGSATSPAPATRPAATSGVSSRSSPSRTGGSSSSSGGSGLVSVQTGEEPRGYSNGLGSTTARVAAPNKSMFSCVADSMNTAVTQMYTFQSDEDGNVHGVDSQGLLAMPDVSRQREN